MIIGIIAIICVHFIIGLFIFSSTEISPDDVSDIKFWKILLIAGPIMLIIKVIGKFKEAGFSWSLREWIIK